MSAEKTNQLETLKKILECRKEIDRQTKKMDKFIEELVADLSDMQLNLLRRNVEDELDVSNMEDQYSTLEEALDSIEGEESKHYIVFGLDTAKDFYSKTARVIRVPEDERTTLTSALLRFHESKQLSDFDYRVLRGCYVMSDMLVAHLMANRFFNAIKASYNHTGVKIFKERNGTVVLLDIKPIG